jgi:hypothetical protein
MAMERTLPILLLSDYRQKSMMQAQTHSHSEIFDQNKKRDGLETVSFKKRIVLEKQHVIHLQFLHCDAIRFEFALPADV